MKITLDKTDSPELVHGKEWMVTEHRADGQTPTNYFYTAEEAWAHITELVKAESAGHLNSTECLEI